ncbi:hypothetical protein COP2_022560 [Malus domestica]
MPQIKRGIVVINLRRKNLFVTVDVAFHENDMYFAHLKSSLQGKNQAEVQTLDYHIPNIDSVNDLDLSGDVLETSGDHSHENNDVIGTKW